MVEKCLDCKMKHIVVCVVLFFFKSNFVNVCSHVFMHLHSTLARLKGLPKLGSQFSLQLSKV